MKFNWRVRTPRGSGPYQHLLTKMERLARRNAELLQIAAAEATDVSRSEFSSKRSGRPFTSERKNRKTTQGRFETYIEWIDGLEHVFLDEDQLRQAAPYYLINEVGTGSRGSGMRMRHDARGRKTGDFVEFPSQRKRYIQPGLAWGDTSGKYVPSRTARYRQDQIHAAERLTIGKVGRSRRKGGPGVNPLRTPRVRISREIQPKHYIKEGAKAGFGAYGQPLRDAARGTFDRR